jgi:hypothetical protein
MKNEGYIMVDHRASPGLSAEVAEKFGYHPSQVKEGALFEAATYGCLHCGATVIKNPLRVRERGFCFQCNDNICDICWTVSREPGYVHRSMKQIADMVNSGKHTMSGSMSRPVFTCTGDSNG